MRKNQKGGVLKWLLLAVLCLGGIAGADEFYVQSISYNPNYKQGRIYFNSKNRVNVPNAEDIIVEPKIERFRVESGWSSSELRFYGDFVPEKTYKVTIKGSVNDVAGDTLGHDAVLRLKIPRLNCSISIGSFGFFVPLGRTEWTLPLKVQNATSVKGVIYRMYTENLIAYDVDSWDLRKTLEEIGSKTFDVTLPDNEKVNCEFKLKGLLPMDVPGLYMIRLEAEDRDKKKDNVRSTDDSRFVTMAVTDLGLTVNKDVDAGRMQVTVVRLSDKTPVADASVELYSFSNQLLKRGVTGKDGQVLLDYKPSDPTKNDKVHIVIVKKDNDVTFAQLGSRYGDEREICQEHPTSFGNDGRKEVFGPNAFVYMERGIARPGEEVVASAYLRDISKDGQKPLEGFPCVMKLEGPDGQVISTAKLKSGEQGWLSRRIKLDESAMTGRYVVKLGIEEGNDLGRTSFMVATYVPDNLRVSVSLSKEVLKADEDLSGFVSANYLYGAPATEASVSTSYRFSLYKPPHWKDYTAGDRVTTKPFEDVSDSFDRLGEKREIPLKWPVHGFCSLPQKVRFEATVLEPGGRGVTGRASAIVDNSNWYLGIRKNSSNGKTVVFDYKALASTTSAKPPFQPCKAQMELKRIEWKCETVERDGQFKNEWCSVKTPVGEFEIELDKAEGQFKYEDLDNGHYELYAKIDDLTFTRMDFWHWQGEVGQRVADPNVITFKMDKENYRAGETAALEFESDDDGQAVVAFGCSGLDGGFAMPVKEGKNTFNIKIPNDLQAERYYCGVTIVKGHGKAFDRVFGLAALPVSLDALKLKVALSAPEIGRPEKPIDIEVTLSDKDGKPVSGLAHVFMVDAGILSLTDFKTPDIFGHFHGPYRCRMAFCDNFAQFYPDLKIDGAVSIGGGAGAGLMDAMSEKCDPLKMKKSAVVVLDAVKTGADGKAKVTVTLPDHLGAMRIMCVASADSLVGNGDREIILRDEIGVLASGPRVVAPGDEFDCTFVLNNFDRPDGEYGFSVTLPEGITAATTAFKGELKRGGSTVCTVRCQAGERLGASDMAYVMTMKDIEKKGVVYLNVRSVNPPVSENTSVVVAPGERKVLSMSTTEWLAGRAKGTVTLSNVPVTGLTDCLDWLNEYPHGCLEQTTSCAFPFLCLPQLVAAGIIDEDEARTHEHKLDDAVRRIQTMYMYHGKFALWPGSDDEHVDAGLFASHFLFARNVSKQLNPKWLETIETHKLESLASNADVSAEKRAYCCYIMSLRDKTTQDGIPTCVAVARNILKGKSNGMAAMLACAALVKSGYAAEAMPRFHKCLESSEWRATSSELLSFSDKASSLGMILTIVMELTPDDKVATAIAAELNRSLRPSGGWGTTQANAWACMGLASYAAHYKSRDIKGTVSKNEQHEEAVGTGVRKYTLAQGDRLEVANTGTAPLFLTFTQKGIRRAPMATDMRGIGIHRQYRNKDGVAVHHAKQGDLLTVRLSLNSVCAMSDMVITDLLPGGFEIEDGSLATRASEKTMNVSREHEIRPIHTDKRDDRFLLYFNVPRGASEISYTVRAVTKGKYVIPPVIVEAMYQPDFRGAFAEDGMLIIE